MTLFPRRIAVFVLLIGVAFGLKVYAADILLGDDFNGPELRAAWVTTYESEAPGPSPRADRSCPAGVCP